MKSTPRPLASLCLAATLLLPAFSSRAGQNVAELPARPAPAWLRDGVIYQIFPRAFSASGNFKGITARLDELKNLGVDVLWLMPIHPIGEKLRKGTYGSPYAIKDYYGINPDYGTADDLKKLVAEAHKRNLKVILDLVANHTAWDNVMMDHPEFYKQDASGKVIPPVAEWTDVAGLNYNNPKLREYMIAMLKHWITEFDIDGYRADVASMVPVDFWEQARVEMEKVKPDIMMLAEASKPDLMVKAFDLDYSWPLHGALNDVLLRGKPATELRRSWEDSLKQYPKGTLHMRISDDHDEARATARFSVRGALAAEVLMLTLDGVPLIYNGMEAGDATESGDPALFEKLPILWNFTKEHPPLRDIYRDLIKYRKAHAAFRTGEVVWLNNSDEKNVVTFLRRDADEEILVVINLSNRPGEVRVNVVDPGRFTPAKLAGMNGDIIKDPNPIALGGFDWRIYHREVAK